jgi:pseudouridine-5'-phosphate glycosidase/pseudouridine kinase
MNLEGLDTTGIVKVPLQDDPTSVANRTAHYIATNDAKKDLFIAMADMQIFASSKYLAHLDSVQDPPNLKWIVVDANWRADISTKITTTYSSKGIKVAYEPVSVAKSSAIFHNRSFMKDPRVFPGNIIDLATPNHYELAAMHAAAKEREYFESDRWWQVIDSLGILSTGARDRFVALTSKKWTDMGVPLQTIQLLPLIPTILTKLGSDGVLLTELLKPDDYRLTDPDSASYILSRCRNGSTQVGGVYMRLFPPVEKVEDVVSVNGVGDTFLGVLIAGLAKGLRLDEELINLAQRGAVMTLRSPESVSPLLSSLRPQLESMSRHD